MKTIFFLFLYLGLISFFGSTQILAESLIPSYPAAIEQAQELDYNSNWSSSDAAIFTTPASYKVGVISRDRFSQPDAKQVHTHFAFSYLHSLNGNITESIYFEFSEFINGSQTVKKIIFPFHSFP